MPSAMVDTTVAATPALDLRLPGGRRQQHRSASSAALSNNAGAAAAAPKAKSSAKTVVASRYLIIPSSATARSSPASTERPRPPQPDAGAATTTRTLAVAFQIPTYSLETSRSSGSVSPAAGPEKTSSRPRNAGAAARAKVSDPTQNTYRWPASSAPCGRAHAGSPDRSGSAPTSNKDTPAAAARFHVTPRRASVHAANEYLLALSSDDTDSSASSGGSGDGGGGVAIAPRRSVGSGSGPAPRPSSLRSVVMGSSARFTTGTRSERFAYPATPSPSRASATSPAPAPAKKRSLFTGLLSSTFIRPSLRQPSPSKPVRSSSFRPSPARRSTEVAASASAGTMLLGKAAAASTGCGLDGGDVKLKATIKAEEEHQLKLLHTRELQWRLVNAQARAALSSQATAAETKLCGAWISILRMRRSVAIRQMQLQLLHNNCRLMAILKGQMKYLEEWSFLERDCARSLSGTAQALNATVVRLPVSDGALADIQGIKNALSSAVDVMHAIGKTSTQLPKLARTNVLVSQLSRVSIQQHILILQCRDLLSTLASMHVKYSSLQGQMIQLKQTRLSHFQSGRL